MMGNVNTVGAWVALCTGRLTLGTPARHSSLREHCFRDETGRFADKYVHELLFTGARPSRASAALHRCI